jgi:hypothetical protein
MQVVVAVALPIVLGEVVALVVVAMVVAPLVLL